VTSTTQPADRPMVGARPTTPPTAPPTAPPTVAPPFAHHSEAEFARILDFYEVRWEYEPHVYPILWSLDGAVQESFAPDFYLPDLDLYVELTTLRQRLVRKKNRKLRRLRELYPDIRIKLFYERDFRALMLKYGKLAIANELSGTGGQVSFNHPSTADGPAAPDPVLEKAPGPMPRPEADTVAGFSSPVGSTSGPAPALLSPDPDRRSRRVPEATAR